MQLKRERRLVKIFVRRNVQYIADPPRWRPQPDCARCCMPATCCAPIALSASDFSDANWDVPVRDRVDRVDLRRVARSSAGTLQRAVDRNVRPARNRTCTFATGSADGSSRCRDRHVRSKRRIAVRRRAAFRRSVANL